MDAPTVISIIALLVSIGSFGITIWATKLSEKSLDHAIRVQDKSDEREFERIRSELLMQVADRQRLLDKTRIEIGTIKAVFDSESQPVQVLLKNYTNLFTEYLPRVEATIAQLDEVWREVAGWSIERDHRELMDAKATLYRSLKDDEVVHDSGMYMLNVFKTKMDMAREYASGVTR